MQLPSNVRLIEVGPRDGLQNEPRPLPTCDKVDLVERLVGVGVREIELTSFVNPKLVPNLADADQIMAATRGLRAQRFALILNAKGYERALQAGAEALTVTLSLTDSHNKQNANRTTHQSVTELGPLGARSRADGLTARVAISMAFGCAFDGAVELTKLQSVIGAMVDGGFRRVVLCDTIVSPIQGRSTTGHSAAWRIFRVSSLIYICTTRMAAGSPTSWPLLRRE